MAIVDLGASGDQRVVPAIRKIAGMGYPVSGYVGNRAPYLWLRHDYVETALAELGDAKQFDIVVHELRTNAYQTAIQKLQIIGGKYAVDALTNSSSYFDPNNPAYGKPFLPPLSRMVQNPPLPPDADPTRENINTWRQWWTKNKDFARFTARTPFE